MLAIPFTLIPITLSIIVITCLISFSAFKNHRIIDALSFWPPAIEMKNEYYRFFTSGLVHADIIHLAFNMITLYFAGANIETHFPGELGVKSYMFAVLYFMAIIAANIPSYLKNKDNYGYRSLGASGGVCAVLFAFILMHPWERVGVFGIPMPAIFFAFLFIGFSMYMSKRGGDNVNHDAHMWGALFGIIFTAVIHPDVILIFVNEMRHPRF